MNDLDHIRYRISTLQIIISLFLALLLDLIPLPDPAGWWLPEFTALVMLYWALHRAETIGIGIAFALGILTDIGLGAPLGSHALAFVAGAYVIQQSRRQILLYSAGWQSLTILGALLLMQLLLVVVHFFRTHQFAGFGLFASPFTGALLWPLLNKIMLHLSRIRQS